MSWVDGPVLVHVGLHKTATSWMQDNFFALPKVGYWVPAVPSTARRPIKELGFWFTTDDRGRLIDPESFDSARMREALQGIPKPESAVAVISNERLGGHPLSNGFDRETIANRIKAVFPHAKIFVSVREQNSVIFSNYIEYLRNGGWHDVATLLDGRWDTRYPMLGLAFWNYDRLTRLYQHIFGEENVLVLPQEMLRRTPDEFISRVARFSGIEEMPPLNSFAMEANPSGRCAPRYHLRRFAWLGTKTSFNAFAPALINHAVERKLFRALRATYGALCPESVENNVRKKLAREIATFVGAYYRESNRAFAKLVDFDPSTYGYES